MKKILFAVLFIVLVLPFGVKAFDYDTYWITTIHGGLVYPMGSFQQTVNPYYGGGVSIRKGLDMEMSVGGGLNYCTMPYKSANAPTSFSSTGLDVEFGFAPYMPDYFIWPYLKAGLGIYMVNYSKLISLNTTQAASDNTFGFTLGGGLNYPLGHNFAINLEALYSSMSLAGGTGDMITYFTGTLGLTIFIK
jgi:opacity protein-like surface antigen